MLVPSFSFEEVAAGKKVRLVTKDGKSYMSAIDFVMVMTDKDNFNAARTLKAFHKDDTKQLNECGIQHKAKGVVLFYSLK